MGDAVGRRQVLQFEAGQAILAQGPLNTFRTQRPGGAQQVDNVPAGVAVLPLPGIGVVKIAIQGEAGYLVVEAQGVVAHAAGMGLRQLGVNAADKVTLRDPLGQRGQRADACDQAGLGMGQAVIGGSRVDHQRLANRVQVTVGAQPGELYRAIPGGVGAECLVVVPVEGIRQR